ncbi:MAG: hypothetical protein M5U12_09995 [Verrucomicrobia bacterium]|nr:hypothetical protein [Verrucomicrobiota bacterium]
MRTNPCLPAACVNSATSLARASPSKPPSTGRPTPPAPSPVTLPPSKPGSKLRLTGLVSHPIVLRSDYAQTYRPGHHNFVEDFVFDPHLEPGLDPALLAELTARNIRAVVGQVSFDQTLGLWIWGLDDRLRDVP